MIELGRPGVFAAAALLTLLPLALHFLMRLAPASAPLPTARFLTPEPLSRVRVARRPTDFGRLIVRMLFVLLLGAAFAEPRISRGAEGTAALVVLDGSAAMAPFWAAAVDSLRGIAAGGAPVRIVVVGTEARSVEASPTSLDSLRAAGPPRAVDRAADPAQADGRAAAPAHVELRALLETLRQEAAELDADSARAWIVFAAVRDAWTPGTAEVRRDRWPGPLGVIAFSPPDSSAAREAAAPPGPVATFARTAEERAWLALALEALGVEGASEEAAQRNPAGLVVATSATVPPDSLTRALERGATVVLTGQAIAALPDAQTPWTRAPGSAASSRHPLVRFEDGLVVRDVEVERGDAAPGARWIAATGDGEPAALSQRVGAGCLVVSGLDPAQLLEAQPAVLPEVLARMIYGCDTPVARADGALPLNQSALARLRGGPGVDLPAPIALASLRGSEPDSLLVRALLLLALGLALLEAYLSYGSRRGSAGAATFASPSGQPAGITLP